MVCLGFLEGLLLGLTESTDHPSRPPLAPKASRLRIPGFWAWDPKTSWWRYWDVSGRGALGVSKLVWKRPVDAQCIPN